MVENMSSDKAVGLAGKTEKILHSILANVDDLIVVVDVNGRRLYNSPSYNKILGDPDELRGTQSFKEIHPDDRSMVKEVFEETVRTGNGRLIVYRLVQKDGTVRYIESRGSAILDSAGKTENVVVVSRDITDRKRMEEERNLLFSAVGQAAESIVITGADARIQYVNPAFERTVGYSRDEVIGKSTRILKSGVHGPDFYAVLWATLLRGEIWSGQITNRRKDGTLYQEEMVISPVRDNAGVVVNYVAIKRDVTHDREIARRLHQSQKAASLTQLAGGIAHDFNNLLGVIEALLFQLKREITDGTLQGYITLGEDAVRRGILAAKRLAAFAGPEGGGPVSLTPAQVIHDLADALKMSIEKTVSVETEVEPHLPHVLGSPEMLLQSLLTICINARDAILAVSSPHHAGRIRIAASLADGRDVHRLFPEAEARTYVRLSIGDNGAGMSEQDRQRIVGTLAAAMDREEGRGLGLAAVGKVVRSHRGFLRVESEMGKGTTFSIFLPGLHVEAQEPAKAGVMKAPEGSETILLIEDEEPLRLFLEAAFVAHGYKVKSAADGYEGLALYEQYRDDIDLVITDMGLPKLSGREVLRKIREIDPEAKIILMSGYVDPDLQSKLYVLGAKAFIPKPFHPDEVLSKIREILDLPG
jgi:PAS domain S-box-containing protein